MHLPLWEEILLVPAGLVVFYIIWWLFEAPGRAIRKSQGTYWKCSANHKHMTPAAANKCSAAQPR
jgi:hypothetical protein